MQEIIDNASSEVYDTHIKQSRDELLYAARIYYMVQADLQVKMLERKIRGKNLQEDKSMYLNAAKYEQLIAADHFFLETKFDISAFFPAIRRSKLESDPEYKQMEAEFKERIKRYTQDTINEARRGELQGAANYRGDGRGRGRGGRGRGGFSTANPDDKPESATSEETNASLGLGFGSGMNKTVNTIENLDVQFADSQGRGQRGQRGQGRGGRGMARGG